MRRLAALIGLAIAGTTGFALVACGSEEAVSLGPPPQQPERDTGTVPGSIAFDAWFASGERLVSVRRTHEATPRPATAALEALLAGPSLAERASGVTSAIPPQTRVLGLSVEDGVATVDLTSEYEAGGGSLSMQMRLGQVVYTLTQFPTVKAVRFELNGVPVNVFSGEGIVLDHPVGRSDYRDLAPAAMPLAGTWRRLPAAPIAAPQLALSVWTGKEMLVLGHVQRLGPKDEILSSRNVAAAYDPARNTWRSLAAPYAAQGYPGRWRAVWTGKEMVVLGDVNQAYDPSTNRWRRIPNPPAGAGGIAVWTGRELIQWGGGCCGDAVEDGAAYDPTQNSWRTLAKAPIGGRQAPVGAWTGRELIIFPGRGPEGERVGGAAYNPTTDSWRRIDSLPRPPAGAYAFWDGREVLVGGGTETGYPLSTVGFAYNPATNHTRRLPPMDSGRTGAAAVWTGKQLLVWGGQTFPGASATARHGLAYDPGPNAWSPLPPAPLKARYAPTAVWTGHELIVWAGRTTSCGLNAPCYASLFTSGAAFRPAAP